MGRPLRLLLPGTTWFVTTRCIDARFLLRPDPHLNATIATCLARALRRYPAISLLGFVALSNHLHLLLHDQRGQLSCLMELFLGSLAKSVNRLRHRRGPLFERRFSAEPVLDPTALLDRWCYLVLNPVRAALVARHDLWPGLCLYAPTDAPRPYTFRLFRHDRYQAARRAARPGQRPPGPQAFYEQVSLTVAPLPRQARPAGGPQGSQSLLEMLRRQEALLAQQRLRTGQRVLGPERVLAQHPLAQPGQPKRSPRPLCHTAFRWLYTQYRDLVRWVRRAYAAASAAYRRGQWSVEFPAYTYRPPVPVLEPG